MNNPKFGTFLVALLSATADCNVSLGVDDEVEIRCASDEECPGNRSCNGSTGLCVPRDRTDLQPPTVLSATLTPDVSGLDGLGFAPVLLSSCGSSCAEYSSSTDPEFAGGQGLGRFLLRGEMRLVITTSGTNGTSVPDARASLSTDYFELRLWSRFPEG